jgi:hypothetical protein
MTESVNLCFFLVTTQDNNPSSRTMALGSIEPLTEMSTRNLPEKMAAGA